jgi:hypothetical protein
MSSRNELILALRTEVTNVGIVTTAEQTLKVLLLTNVSKQLLVGRSKDQIVTWLNSRCRSAGSDMHGVYVEVYGLIKDVVL